MNFTKTEDKVLSSTLRHTVPCTVSAHHTPRFLNARNAVGRTNKGHRVTDFESRHAPEISLFSIIEQTGTPSLIFSRYQGSFPRIKRLGRESHRDHSPPSINDVQNVWSYTNYPPAGYHGLERDNSDHDPDNTPGR